MGSEQQHTQLLEELRRHAADSVSVYDDYWGYDQYLFPHPNSVENSMLKYIIGEGISLQDIVEQRRASGKTTHVLELFGSGAFLSNPQAADSITGVRLTDKHYSPAAHIGRNFQPRPDTHVVIPGSLYEQETWDAIKNSMKERNIPHFDIVVCNPLAGWPIDWKKQYDLATFLSVYHPLLEETYSLLSPDNGKIYTAVPKNIGLGTDELQAWSNKMTTVGIPTIMSSYTNAEGARRRSFLDITRMNTSPAEIVALSSACRGVQFGRSRT